MGEAIPGVWLDSQREVDHGGGSSCCLRRSCHSESSAAMSPIVLFLKIVAVVGIIMAIVFLEMVGVAIAEAISREAKEKNKNKDNKTE